VTALNLRPRRIGSDLRGPALPPTWSGFDSFRLALVVLPLRAHR